MQSSRKSFKAFSIAQPLKREIDETLVKLELQKRKFLTLEREEIFLKDNLQKKRKQLNDLRAKQPQTRTYTSKTSQTSTYIYNVDRNYQNAVDSIQQQKTAINIHRRQINKYKQTNDKLIIDTNNIVKKIKQYDEMNTQLQNQNEEIKQEIMKFRELNFKNVNEFQMSHINVNKSNFKEENQRKKFSVTQKTFLGEELRNSKILPIDILSDQLRDSGIKFTDSKNQIMTQSVPLAKERIKNLIFKNKQKLKITENYRKFGENLEQMFKIMKQYKGRDDIDFISSEFVTKERQLQKIEEYIALIEARIGAHQKLLKTKEQQDLELKAELQKKVERSDDHYAVLEQKVQRDIQKLKKDQHQFNEWFAKVGGILFSLTDQHLTRGNAPQLIGEIEEQLRLKREEVDKKGAPKATHLPSIEQDQKQTYNQLLSYEKMRQFAAEYVRNKKN